MLWSCRLLLAAHPRQLPRKQHNKERKAMSAAQEYAQRTSSFLRGSSLVGIMMIP
jgi:hypothetical protein